MKRKHSNGEINRAGLLLSTLGSDPEALERAHRVIADWRQLHGYPLTTVAATLRKRTVAIDSRAIVAQRLKRLVSIQSKLTRYGTALTGMQDIGGCRAVVKNADDVFALKRLYQEYARRYPTKGPEIVRTKDYLLEPKEDGYRSLHVVVRFRSERDVVEPCVGLRVEIQIRSRMQHAWAMAVETADSLTYQALKFGKGREDWARFFRLMGSAIAMEEDLPLVPYTDEVDVYKQIREISDSMRIVPLFQGISQVVNDTPRTEPSDLIVLESDSERRTINSTVFHKQEADLAYEYYADSEWKQRSNPNVHVVLVSVQTISKLRSAYPSYFHDTSAFLRLLRKCCHRGEPTLSLRPSHGRHIIGD